MDLKEIEKLMAAMKRTGTTELGIKQEGFEINLKRPEPDDGACHSTVQFEVDPAERIESSFQKKQAASTLSGKETQSLAHAESKPAQDTNALYVTSPMVGTFYSSPSPEEPSFAKIGDHIEKNTIVCIIEAMKVMNEVKGGLTGTVAEVLVENGHPVEFGTKLFRITPQ